MKSKVIFGLALSIALAKSPSAQAWGDLGHQIVGAVAEARMLPETRDFVRGILGIEPVAIAANWPDHVRDDARFSHKDSDFAPFHFSEIPTGFSFTTRLTKNAKDAYSALIGASKILVQGSGATNEEKLIALRYLIHVVGDIHQPLHVGNGFDRGGNECHIKLKPKTKPENLHKLWDTNLVLKLGDTYKNPENGKSPRYYPQFISAMKMKASTKFNAEKLVFETKDDASFSADFSKSLIGWLDQSAKYRETIYPDDLNGNPEAYKMRNYCRWYIDQEKGTLSDTSATSIKDADAKLLPTDYVTKNVPLVESRLIDGGLHLAAVLDAIAIRAKANNANQNLITDEKQDAILKRLLLEMKYHD